MPVASGQYWNSIHDREIGEAIQDEEGLEEMRTFARNMVFLMRSIAMGKHDVYIFNANDNVIRSRKIK